MESIIRKLQKCDIAQTELVMKQKKKICKLKYKVTQQKQTIRDYQLLVQKLQKLQKKMKQMAVLRHSKSNFHSDSIQNTVIKKEKIVCNDSSVIDLTSDQIPEKVAAIVVDEPVVEKEIKTDDIVHVNKMTVDDSVATVEESAEEEEVEVEVEESAEEAEVEVEVEESAEEEEEEEEEVEVEESAEEEEEEEEEVFMVSINGKDYYTNNEQSGTIYSIVDEDDIGDEIGVFKNGKAVFNK